MASSHSDTHSNLPLWRPHYWLFAALPVALLFASDFIEILMYDHARAPNAGAFLQIILLLFFYALWPLVPRMVWQLVSRLKHRLKLPNPSLAGLWLGGFGFVAFLAHMMVLAVVLRYLYSPPGWGFADYVHSVTELWIQHAGLWFFVYGCTCAAVVWRHNKLKSNSKEVPVFKVRQGQRTILVDLPSVDWIEACGNYVDFHRGGESFLVRKSLAALEQEARRFGFVRSHRSALVNIARVSSLVSADGQWVELQGGDRVPLSRRRAAHFKKALL